MSTPEILSSSLIGESNTVCLLEALPNRALLAIKWHREGRRAFWHWVVFIRESGGAAVLDSKKMLKHHVRKDFWRMKPKWFIEVQ